VPCNTIQRSQIAFLPTTTNTDLLIEALRSIGFTSITLQGELLSFRMDRGSGSYHKATGRLTLPATCDVNTIKRAYSVQIVQSQAVKNGWKIAWSTNAQDHKQAIVQRRG
jgi:hypothetical protein